jgi:hypothetical protein
VPVIHGQSPGDRRLRMDADQVSLQAFITELIKSSSFFTLNKPQNCGFKHSFMKFQVNGLELQLQ